MPLDHNATLSTEAQLSANPTAIYQQWQTQAKPGSLQGKDNLTLRYAALRHPKPPQRGTLIFLSGRTESYLKYQELALDLYHQGYDVYMLDHRGQGLSDRLLTDPHKGHVVNFSDYAADADTFIRTVVKAQAQPPYFLLAHSMGGAIGASYLSQYPDHGMQAAVLSSPMLGIELGLMPRWLALGLTRTLRGFSQFLGQESRYAPGQGAYAPEPFATNPYTHSPIRYERMQTLYRQQALTATFNFFTQAHKE